MTGDRIPTYQNAVPDAAIEIVAKQVLGARLVAWSKHESGRLCGTFEEQREQLDQMNLECRKRLNAILLGDFDVPHTGEGNPVMSRDEYRKKLMDEINGFLAVNVAMLDKLTTIYLKLSAGGHVAILSAMKQTREISQADNPPEERNVTTRRRFGAGRELVVDAQT